MSTRCCGLRAGSSRWAARLMVALACALIAFVLAWFGASSSAMAEDLGEPKLAEAQAAMVVDSEGNVLFSKNPDAEINMASITKIMTAVVALESGAPLDATYQLHDVTLAENAVVAGYHEGMTSTLRDLMRVMLVLSANDAASEVAVAVGGSEAAGVQMMNDKAAELGLTHTHFENPHGLDAEGHHSSVSDLTKLARYAMTKHPFIADTVRLKSVTAPVGGVQVTFETSDSLLYTYRGMLGIKTGAGDAVTSFLGAARRDGTTLYTCVLGCTTKQGRFDDTASMLDWAFDAYGRHELAGSYRPVAIEPYAYHFGLSCVVSADATTYGLVWPGGGATTYQRTMLSRGTLVEPSETLGVCEWVQDGRTVGTISYSARERLVWTRTGFGLSDQLGSLGIDAGRAA